MGLKKAFDSMAWDYLLCLAISWALSATVLAGFNAPQTAGAYVAYGAACAVLLIPLFASGRSQKTLWPGIAAFVALCLVCFVAAGALSTVDSLLDDELGNWLIPMIAIAVVVAIAYGLSRSRLGAVGLFALGFVTCAFIQFMYKEGHVAADIVFLVASVSMIVYRNFANSLKSVDVVQKTSHTSGFASSLAMAAQVLGLGAVVFLLVIAPLNPPTAELKIIQEFRKLPEIAAHNPQATSDVIDESIYSSKYDDVMHTTSYQKEGENGVPVPIENKRLPNEEDDTVEGTYADLDDTSQREEFSLLDYGSHRTLPLLTLIIAGLILMALLAVLAKLARRRAWYRKLREQSPHRQVVDLYNFFVARFAKLGLEKPEASTPAEYASARHDTISRFEQANCDVAFEGLTDAFMDVAYGKDQPTSGQLDAFHRYYQAFYKNCSSFLGKWGYARKFFAM